MPDKIEAPIVTYDQLGRVSTVTYPEANETHYSYYYYADDQIAEDASAADEFDASGTAAEPRLEA